MKNWDKWELYERYIPNYRKRLPKATIRALPFSLQDDRNGSILQSVKWGLGAFNISINHNFIILTSSSATHTVEIMLMQPVIALDGKYFKKENILLPEWMSVVTF